MQSITLTIDDHPIAAAMGDTILQAASQNNISIPTICFHEATTSNA